MFIKNVNNLNNNVIFGNFAESVYGLENLSLCDFGVHIYTNVSGIENAEYVESIDEIFRRMFRC